MRQALHILKKDTRYLRWEILLVLAFMGMFVYAQAHPDESDNAHRDMIQAILVACLWALVCARLVQAETIPGDCQFWITRPYSWRSLLGAKSLFVVLFLSIPLLVADAIILAVEGFSVVEHIPGLLWSVLLITAGSLATLCAFAALMRGLTQWIIGALLAVGVFFGLEEIGKGNDWGREEWMRQLGVTAMLFVLASMVLLWQYRTRRTTISRIAMAVGLLTVSLCWDNAPPAIGYEAQMALSRPKVDTSHIQVALHELTPGEGTLSASPAASTDGSRPSVRVQVPPENKGEPVPFAETNDGKTKYVSILLDASGVAEDTPLFVYHVRATYELESCPDAGTTWRADGDILETLRLPVGSGFYTKSILCRTKIRLTLYMTLLGNPVTKVIKTDAEPLPIPGVGVCSVYGLAYRCFGAYLPCGSPPT